MVLTLGFVVFLNARLFPPVATVHSLQNVVTELTMVVLAIVWVLILDPRSVRTSVYYALWLGSLLVIVGNLQYVLNEFFRVVSGFRSIKSLSVPVGMSFITLGLVLWLRSNREAYRRLEEHKDRYEHLSRTDALTQLFNSRHYYHQLYLEMERTERYGRPLSLLFLDIDDFKAYNDVYGHVAGDKVLKTLGGIIRTVLRENDSGYRYGGEEFTILLPETDEDEALVVAERIRKDFARTLFYPGTTNKTLSVGVTALRAKDDAESFTKRADKAMYQAKLMGKNVSYIADR